jgi:hypothetical protein
MSVAFHKILFPLGIALKSAGWPLAAPIAGHFGENREFIS